MDMQSVLFQLLASRGGQSNPAMAQLIASMQAGGTGAAAKPNMQDLISQMRANGSPLPDWMLNLVNKRRPEFVEAAQYTVKEHNAAKVETAESQADAPNEQKPVPENASLTVLEELWTERRELKKRNDTLAAAVGACNTCWGGLAECPLCSGEGKPGWKFPNMKLFSEWILPAIRTVRLGKPKTEMPSENQGEAAEASKKRTTENQHLKGETDESI